MSGFLSTSQVVGEKPIVSTTRRCGGACKLCHGCETPYLEPKGSGKFRILFVGSTPEENDDEKDRPFSGPGGKLLRRVLRKMDLDLNSCRMTYAVRCRPGDRNPSTDEIESCRILLQEELEENPPLVIVPLGDAAIRAVVGQEWKKGWGKEDPTKKWVGWTIPSRKFGAWVCPTYDPSWVVEKGDDVLQVLLERHLRAALEKANQDHPGVHLEDLEAQVEALEDPGEIVRRLDRFRKKWGTVAFDYETTGLKPDHPDQSPVCVSICWGGEETIVFRLGSKDEMDPGVWKAFRRLLRAGQVGKIASNLKFEERWTRAKFGLGVENWIWDTMIASHVLDNRSGISSIKFQSFVRYGIADYDSHLSQYLRAEGSNDLNRIGEIDWKDLALYCGLDSILEYLVAMDQMKEFKYPWPGEKTEVALGTPRKRSKRRNR